MDARLPSKTVDSIWRHWRDLWFKRNEQNASLCNGSIGKKRIFSVWASRSHRLAVPTTLRFPCFAHRPAATAALHNPVSLADQPERPRSGVRHSVAHPCIGVRHVVAHSRGKVRAETIVLVPLTIPRRSRRPDPARAKRVLGESRRRASLDRSAATWTSPSPGNSARHMETRL